MGNGGQPLPELALHIACGSQFNRPSLGSVATRRRAFGLARTMLLRRLYDAAAAAGAPAAAGAGGAARSHPGRPCHSGVLFPAPPDSAARDLTVVGGVLSRGLSSGRLGTVAHRALVTDILHTLVWTGFGHAPTELSLPRRGGDGVPLSPDFFGLARPRGLPCHPPGGRQ